MVKADVVRRVRLETGISQGEAEDLINELLEIMQRPTMFGQELSRRGVFFGGVGCCGWL